jgi:hypothetical protein
MPFNIYCYKDEDGSVPFKDWYENLQKVQLSKLNSKLDALNLNGETLRPHVLTDTDEPGIFKVRVKGNVQLRPLLCRTPDQTGYVFLVGAKEVQSKLSPKEILEKAVKYKNKVYANFDARTIKHERYD